MVGTSDFKKGLKLMIEEQPYTITDFQHHKPGKGNSVTRIKLKHLVTGGNLEKTVKSGDKFQVPDVEYADMNYLYQDDTGFHFMDQTTYEQLSLSSDVLGDATNFLMENLEVKVVLYNERAVAVELPNTVVSPVKDTDPGHKGNTVTGAQKPATLECGAKVNVPLHISIGDPIKVDTRTGEYMERVSKT